MLVFGLRRGGSSDDIASGGPWGGYFAIDVSQPYLDSAPHDDGAPSYMSDGPKMLFSVDSSTSGFEEMGQSWSQPRLAKVLDGAETNETLRYGNNQNFPNDINPDSVVLPQVNDGGLVSGAGRTSTGTAGPDTWNGTNYAMRGRAMYAIKVASLVDSGSGYLPDFGGAEPAGTVVWEYDIDNNANLDYPIASDMTAGDLNGDGYIDAIYVGDTGGRLWRFSSSTFGDADVNFWGGEIIFDTNNTNGTQDVLPSGELDVGRKIFYRRKPFGRYDD